MVKKTKSSEKWGQLLASAIVTPNFFVVFNEILDDIFIASSGTSSKIGLDQLLAVLPNVVSSSRLLLVLEAKQSLPVGSPVLENWANQIKTELSLPLVSGAISGGAWETITNHQRFAGWMASTLVSGATFKIKLAHIKAVFQSVHGFLDAKSVLKDNVKLFCVEFAFQTSLDAVFLVELTSSVCFATLKIAKFLVVSESEFPFAAVALHNVPLDMSAANIKTALSVFGMVTRVMLKPAGIWQYVVVYFEKLNSAISALNHWSVLVNRNSVRILPLVGGQSCFISQSFNSGCHLCFALIMFGFQADLDFACQETGHLAVDCKVASFPFLKIPKVFKPHFVGSLSYAKAFASPVMSEFPSLMAFTPFVAVVNPAVGSRLNSLEKQILDLAALVKSIVESVGSLVALVSCFLDDNAVQLKKDLLSIKYASNNFANFLVGVFKDIVCLRSEVDFGGMDYNNIQTTKSFFLNEDTVKCVIALW
ncbi:hypothetical protein G9A89_000907 [Geosiphon pyriformis]|nr:hypothetical protein G9A89_000907 [Geosiphon pyriformis]